MFTFVEAALIGALAVAVLFSVGICARHYRSINTRRSTSFLR